MPTFSETFNVLMENFMREKLKRDDVTLLSWSEERETSGGCPTCAWEETIIEFIYSVPGESTRSTYTYWGGFSELIRELSSLGEQKGLF